MSTFSRSAVTDPLGVSVWYCNRESPLRRRQKPPDRGRIQVFRKQSWSNFVVVQSGRSHLRLKWHSVRVVKETLLAVTPQGVPVALPKGMVLFGPVEEAGDFAMMMQDSRYYKCHIDELLRYTCEICPAAVTEPIPRLHSASS